jgi:hypothetical protein
MAAFTRAGWVRGAMWPASANTAEVTLGKVWVSSLATARVDAGDLLPSR